MHNTKSYLYKTTGEKIEVTPKNGTDFVYEELTAFVGGMVEIVPLPSGRVMVCNEEGRLIGLPHNALASQVWNAEYPINQYPLNNPQDVRGDVLFCESNLIK
jgi:hypothetical protein